MQNKDQVNMSFRLGELQVLESIINKPPVPPTEINPADYVFNIDLNRRLDHELKFVVLQVRVILTLNSRPETLATITTVSLFEIDNFDEVTISNGSERELQPQWVNLLISISISTTRGIIYSLLRGGPYDRALLPIVDPNNFKAESNHPEKLSDAGSKPARKKRLKKEG